MRADVPELVPLVCPACRTHDAQARRMHTLALERTLRPGAANEVLEGILRCENGDCARRYPVVDGIPIVLPDPARVVVTDAAAVVEGDLTPELAGLLAQAGTDEAPLARLLEHLSIYLDAHWGDRAEPPPDGPGPRHGFAELGARIAARAELRVERAVELGSSVGRGLAELARGAALVVGVDLHLASLRRARRLLAGADVPFARRRVGRHYEAATIRPAGPAPAVVALVCGDALDPPLVPNVFARVLALNVLDAVANPGALVSVVDGLCVPGGEVLLASPYAWQSAFVAEEHRLGGADPAGALAGRLREGRALEAPYAVEEEADVSWWLRRDARSGVAYAVHYLRARKTDGQ